MKRGGIILIGGIVLGILACVASYAILTASHRSMLKSPQPELAWLQREFSLTDPEMDRIEELHDAYLPQCAEMCSHIEATNMMIRQKLLESSTVTPELEALLNESAKLRAQCQKQMLEHFYAVSREMSPEQGRRYLNWVQDRLFAMNHEPISHPKHSSHGN